jgi:amino acid transporter
MNLIIFLVIFLILLFYSISLPFKRFFLKRTADEDWKEQKLFAIIAPLIVIAMVIFSYYSYTHSNEYLINKSDEICVREERKSFKQCRDEDIRQFVEACKSIDATETIQQCEYNFRDWYYGN